MIYVAPGSPERLAALTAEGNQGLVVLVVPVESLVGGRPPGVRGSMRATLDVSGCRGFVVGARREPERVRAKQAGAA